jgi:hypothetical protein
MIILSLCTLFYFNTEFFYWHITEPELCFSLQKLMQKERKQLILLGMGKEEQLVI